MRQGQIIKLNSKENKEYIRAYLVSTEGIQSVDEDPAVKRLYALLPTFRKEKVDKIKNENTKIQSVVAFGLLGYALRQASLDSECKTLQGDFYPSSPYDWDKLGYSIDEHGKPFLEKINNLYFSISHTNGMVMCAVADRPVGCDVEIINRYKVDYDINIYAQERKRLAQRFYTPVECQYIDASEEAKEVPIRFTRIWTRKESYVKYLGLGLSKPLNEFDVFNCSPIPEVVYEDEKYIASICVDLK